MNLVFKVENLRTGVMPGSVRLPIACLIDREYFKSGVNLGTDSGFADFYAYR